MNGQKLSYNEKQKKMDEYIVRMNPYKKLVPLKFNLRAYASYVEDNNINPKDITMDIVQMFAK